MAEFKTVMREFQRLCSESRCENCPFRNEVFNERATFCSEWIKNHPEEAETIIMQWSSEHPIVTNRMKFREVFGKDIVICGGDDSWLDQEYKGAQDAGET